MEDSSPGLASSAKPDTRLLPGWYLFAALLALFVYFYGLDSDHVPKNGDEYPYAHIARVTAASGHLLPLRSELSQMRNTKPPLLFWQGIISTHWGKDWSRWNLRYPSVNYTILTAALVFVLGRKLAGTWETGVLAFLTFLAFFSTYRYGRPFLTNPPEVFWLFLPFFMLLYWQPKAFDSGLTVPLLAGLATGVGLLYKSFALVLPVSMALAWWYLRLRRYQFKTFLCRDSWKVAIVAGLALGVFCLWFVFDPNPGAIFKEFVLGENLRKFDPKSSSYLSKLLWGDSSIWSLALGYPLDAGLLAPPLLAVCYVSFRRRRNLSDSEKMLWIWIATLFIVFSLPSQRDERYLLAGMPAFAVLAALNWHRLSRKIFLTTVVAAAAVVAVLAYLSLRLEHGIADAQVYPAMYWLLLIAVGALSGLGLTLPRMTSHVVNVIVLLVFLSFAGFMRPLDTRFGIYSRQTQDYLRGRDVWVPTNFTAKEEGHRFFLPAANLHAYRYDSELTAEALGDKYPVFAVILPLDAPIPAYGKVIGQRLDVGGRHSSAQIKQMILGKVYENLFIKELLIEGHPEHPEAVPPQPGGSP